MYVAPVTAPTEYLLAIKGVGTATPTTQPHGDHCWQCGADFTLEHTLVRKGQRTPFTAVDHEYCGRVTSYCARCAHSKLYIVKAS